jgi:hypothetical protein
MYRCAAVQLWTCLVHILRGSLTNAGCPKGRYRLENYRMSQPVRRKYGSSPSLDIQTLQRSQYAGSPNITLEALGEILKLYTEGIRRDPQTSQQSQYARHSKYYTENCMFSCKSDNHLTNSLCHNSKNSNMNHNLPGNLECPTDIPFPRFPSVFILNPQPHFSFRFKQCTWLKNRMPI